MDTGQGGMRARDEWRGQHGNIHSPTCKTAMGTHCMIQGAQTSALSQPRGVGWGRKERQEEGDICIPMADSCCCMAESNIIL